MKTAKTSENSGLLETRIGEITVNSGKQWKAVETRKSARIESPGMSFTRNLPSTSLPITRQEKYQKQQKA